METQLLKDEKHFDIYKYVYKQIHTHILLWFFMGIWKIRFNDNYSSYYNFYVMTSAI